MILARPSQCKLTSLDVFDDDIPQVSKYEACYSLTRRKQTLSRLARGCRKTWQWSRLWWGEGEGNMTTSTLRILPAVSMSELCCQNFFYFEKHDCNILNVHLFWNRYPDNGGYSQLKYSQLKIYFSQTVDPWLVSFEYFFHWVPEAMAMICDQSLQKLHHWRIHLNTQDSQILNPEMVLTIWGKASSLKKASLLHKSCCLTGSLLCHWRFC